MLSGSDDCVKSFLADLTYLTNPTWTAHNNMESNNNNKFIPLFLQWAPCEVPGSSLHWLNSPVNAIRWRENDWPKIIQWIPWLRWDFNLLCSSARLQCRLSACFVTSLHKTGSNDFILSWERSFVLGKVCSGRSLMEKFYEPCLGSCTCTWAKWRRLKTGP